MCKKCAKGGFCLDCYKSLPYDMQKKYSRQLKMPIIILSVALFVIAVPMVVLAPGFLICLVLIGCKAYSLDHGKYKTTRKSVLRKARNILADLGQISPQAAQSLQTSQPQQNPPNPQDPDQQYKGTFWLP